LILTAQNIKKFSIYMYTSAVAAGFFSKRLAAAAENCLGLGGGGWIFFEKISGGG
jgi:hypothetical protein